MTDARNFLFNSDFPIDKIIGFQTGSFTKTSADSAPFVVAHGFSFAPLYILQWSTSSTFVPAFSEQLLGDGFTPLLEAQTTATDVKFFYNVPSAPVTFHYRVYFMMPPDVDVSVPILTGLDNFRLNTDFNYTKIIEEGKILSTTTITHGLGYFPLVDFWIHRTSDDVIRHFPVSETDAGNEGGAIVTTTTVTFYLPTGHDFMYYKIYGDS